MEEQEIIVLDVETKKSFDEVGGFENRDKLGVSYLGVYSYSQDKFFGFFEEELEAFEKVVLATNPTIVGFNSLHFDLPVIQPYMHKVQLAQLPHVDLLRDIEKVLGHRVKLDTIAQATLFSQKSGDGLEAIRWYREGNFESLAKYCDDDVRITRDVYDFGIRHGVVYYTTGGEKRPVKALWSNGDTTIADRVAEAFKKHEQLHIEYMELDESESVQVVPRTIEVLEMNDDKLKAFCHTENGTRDFRISQIWNIEETGNTFAHQAPLF